MFAAKAPEYILAIHAISSVVMAMLLFVHILLHSKIITRNKAVHKTAFALVLTIVIGYSLVGTVSGAAKWTEKKPNKLGMENHDASNGENIHKPKENEKK
jgi:hypothetical protein